MSLKIDVECPTQGTVRKQQPLLKNSNCQEILQSLADRNIDIKLENIKSFDYEGEEIHVKKEFDEVELENEECIVTNEASFDYRPEEIQMKKELNDVKLENDELIIKSEVENEIDM